MHQFRSFTSHSLAALLEAGIIAFILAALVVAPALAAKGGNGGSGKGPDKAGGYGSSSLELVYLDDSDGNQVPNHGDTVGFVVSTSATDRPFVSLNCYQGNAWVYSASVGYFAAYPWSQQFVLSAASWPEGAASCMARLYLSKDGSRTTTLATLAVAVEE